MLEGIEAALIRAGYDLTLYRLSTDHDLRRRVFDYFLVRKRVDAVIAVTIALSPHEVEMLQALGKPLVAIGGRVAGIPSLSIDDVETSRLATEHLISLGTAASCTSAAIRTSRWTSACTASATRGSGGPHEVDIVVDDDFREAEFSIPGGYAAGLAVLGDPRTRPTAIFAGCDEIAVGIMIAARQLGIGVPHDLSIIGIDDHPLAESLGITTLAQQPGAQGGRAVELLLEQPRPPRCAGAGRAPAAADRAHDAQQHRARAGRLSSIARPLPTWPETHHSPAPSRTGGLW